QSRRLGGRSNGNRPHDRAGGGPCEYKLARRLDEVIIRQRKHGRGKFGIFHRAKRRLSVGALSRVMLPPSHSVYEMVVLLSKYPDGLIVSSTSAIYPVDDLSPGK